jgi:hypothetical protein
MTREYHQIRELMALTTALVLAEKRAELADLMRIGTVVGDSVPALRECVAALGELTRPGDPGSTPRGGGVAAQEAYQRGAAALSFEDLVQQVLAFASYRGREIERILHKIESGVDALGASPFDSGQFAELIAEVGRDIEQFRVVLGTGRADPS